MFANWTVPKRLFILCLCCWATVLDAKQVIQVWSYHNFPPFVVDLEERQGLTFDLARAMEELSDGRYRFEVAILPRPEINQRLAKGTLGIVLWVNPVWFADRERIKFLWTRAIMTDGSGVISPRRKPVRYNGPASIIGLHLIGVKGHRYAGADELVAQGVVRRTDLASELEVFRHIDVL